MSVTGRTDVRMPPTPQFAGSALLCDPGHTKWTIQSALIASSGLLDPLRQRTHAREPLLAGALERAHRRLPRAVHGRARRDRRERRAPFDPDRSAPDHVAAAVDRQLLHAALRRLPAAR